MTKDTSAITKRITDLLLVDRCDIEFKWKEYIGGKRYTSVYINNRQYKLLFSGAKGSLLEKYNRSYEVVEISFHNFMFLFNLCKLRDKLFNDLTVVKNNLTT